MGSFFRRSSSVSPSNARRGSTLPTGQYAPLIEETLLAALQFDGAGGRFYKRFDEYRHVGRRMDPVTAAALVKSVGNEVDADLNTIALSVERLKPGPEEYYLEYFHSQLVDFFAAWLASMDDDNIHFAVSMLLDNPREIRKWEKQSQKSAEKREAALENLRKRVRALHFSRGAAALLKAGLTQSVLIWLELDDIAEKIGDAGPRASQVTLSGETPSGAEWSLSRIRMEGIVGSGPKEEPFYKSFARNVRVRHMCEENAVSVPDELREFNTLMRELDDLWSLPRSWQDTDSSDLTVLAFYRIFRYALTNDTDDIPNLGALLSLLNLRVAPAERKHLLVNVSTVLNSNDREVNGLLPFIQADRDLGVISSAALSYACTFPANGDPMAGPKALVNIATRFSGDDEVTSVGVLQGVIALGDTRTLQALEGTWNGLSPQAKAALSEIGSETLYAGSVFYWMRWLANVNEEDFGFAGRALTHMVRKAEMQPIQDVERRFPAPFTMSHEEQVANPPIRVLNSWTKDEFAPYLELGFRLAYLRETYDKIMPFVMRDWGIEPGEDSIADQMRRIRHTFDNRVEALRNLASPGTKVNWEPRHPEQNARALISGFFSIYDPATALSHCLQAAENMQKNASSMSLDALAQPDPGRKREMASESSIFSACAESMLALMRGVVGPDLHGAVKEFDVISTFA